MRLFSGGDITRPLIFSVPARNRNRSRKTIPDGNSHSRPEADVAFIIGIDPVLAGTFKKLDGSFDISDILGDIEQVECHYGFKLFVGRPAHRQGGALGFSIIVYIIDDRPMGLFYTGYMVLGRRLGLETRNRLSRWLGSACHLYRVAPAGKGEDWHD